MKKRFATIFAAFALVLTLGVAAPVVDDMPVLGDAVDAIVLDASATETSNPCFPFCGGGGGGDGIGLGVGVGVGGPGGNGGNGGAGGAGGDANAVGGNGYGGDAVGGSASCDFCSASAGNGGTAEASANGGNVVLGDINSGGNTGNVITVKLN